jgi:uncharacterized protein YmfQ (DUF2313 family)
MAVNLTPLVPVKRFNIASYKQMLINLLPPGHIWRNLGANFKLFLEAFAVELDRIEQTMTDLIRESVPGLSTEALLLAEWEAAALLPDEMPLDADTELQRQLTVHAKITQQMDFAGKDFFIAYAGVLGMTITITSAATPNAFRVGEDTMGTALAPDGSPFYWVVTVTADPNGNVAKMITAFRRLKPAHTAFIHDGTEYHF